MTKRAVIFHKNLVGNTITVSYFRERKYEHKVHFINIKYGKSKVENKCTNSHDTADMGNVDA
jgi:hypothetical protein